MVSVRRHLAVLRSTLQPGERERLWRKAERQPQGHVGALLVTDRRLLFTGTGFVQQSLEAWPLAVVAAPRLVGGALELTVLGLPERFTGRADELAEVAELLGERQDDGAGASDVSSPALDDLPGQLERLARLRDDGVLTATEFEGAKRRLLDASG